MRPYIPPMSTDDIVVVIHGKDVRAPLRNLRHAVGSAKVPRTVVFTMTLPDE